MRNTVAEISRICLTLGINLLTLPLEMHRDTSRSGPRSRIAGVVLASMLAACGSVPGKEEAKPEAVVRALAQERAKAVVAGDVARIYGYLSPTTREAMSLDAFRNTIRAGFWTQAEVVKVDCQPEVCDVELQVTYVYRGSSIVTPVRESWIRSGGGWWHVYKPT